MRNLITSGSFLLGNIKGREFFINLDSLKQFFRRFFRKNIRKTLVSELGMSDFHTWHSRPKSSTDVHIEAIILEEIDTAIVVQGPIIKEWNFTEESLLLYRKHFPKSPIVFSTWESEDQQILQRIRNLGVHVVLSKYPKIPGLANLNYQIVSSRNGVQYAKSLGAKFTVKTRSDQRFYSPIFISSLKADLALTNTSDDQLQVGSLVTLDIDTFRFRLYGVSDFMTFGLTEDVLNYWSCQLDSRLNIPLGKEHFETLFAQSKAELPETYLAVKYLEKIGVPLNWTVKDWWEIATTNFVVTDANSLDFFWPKYSRREHRWTFYGENSDLAPLDNALWKVIKARNKEINYSFLEKRLHKKIN